MNGWILLHRQICDNAYLWEDKPYTRGQAWIDLLILANPADEYESCKSGEKTLIPRGSLKTTIRYLANRWGWSRTKISDFLNSLQSAGMLKIEGDKKKTVLTIANYEDFQKPKTKKRQTAPLGKDEKKTDTLLKKETNVYISTSPDSSNDEIRDKRKSDYEKNALLAAQYMAKKIEGHTPGFPQLRNGKKDETVARWAKDIEKLLRIDKPDFEEFKRVLWFSQTDPFWQKNILSGEKLRKQYGQLLAKAGGSDER